MNRKNENGLNNFFSVGGILFCEFELKPCDNFQFRTDTLGKDMSLLNSAME